MGVCGDQGLELGGEGCVPSPLEIGCDTGLERCEACVVEPRRLRPRERLVREVGERRAAPERERLDRLLLGDESLEALGVDLAVVGTQQVSGRTGRDPVGPQACRSPSQSATRIAAATTR